MSASPIQIERYAGGRQWLVAGGGAGLVLLLASLGGFAVDPKAAAYSYLVAFAYWAGIAFASVLLLQIFHATRAKWMVILRRPVEIMASTIPLFILLFVPWVIDMLFPAWDAKRQTLHDKVSRTVVLKTSVVTPTAT